MDEARGSKRKRNAFRNAIRNTIWGLEIQETPCAPISEAI